MQHLLIFDRHAAVLLLSLVIRVNLEGALQMINQQLQILVGNSVQLDLLLDEHLLYVEHAAGGARQRVLGRKRRHLVGQVEVGH